MGPQRWPLPPARAPSSVAPAGPRTHILSSMQYTADGRDLLGAFTRATFCTVVSSSPGEGGICESPGCPVPPTARWPLGDPPSCAVGRDRHQSPRADKGNGESREIRRPSRATGSAHGRAAIPTPRSLCPCLHRGHATAPRGEAEPPGGSGAVRAQAVRMGEAAQRGQRPP